MRQLLSLLAGSVYAGSENAVSKIDPKAESIVKALSKANNRAGQIRFKVYDTSEEITESGEMIQYGHVRTAVLKRPDRLWMETRGDQANTTLWYDGALFTLLDRDKNVYVQLKAPATLDETIDMVYDRYGISTPLADIAVRGYLRGAHGRCYNLPLPGAGACGGEKMPPHRRHAEGY